MKWINLGVEWVNLANINTLSWTREKDHNTQTSYAEANYLRITWSSDNMVYVDKNSPVGQGLKIIMEGWEVGDFPKE